MRNTWSRLRWTLWMPGYDFVARIFKKPRRRSLQLLDLQPDERVLLVGAGTGLDLPLIPAGPTITAIDLVRGMLRRLRRRAQDLGRAVDARVMDAQALEFPDGSFDVAILHLILAVIPDPARCLREVARVLRPGGRAVILDKFIPDDGPPPLLLRVLNPLARILATNLTRRIGPVVSGSGLRIVKNESAGFHGLLRIILLRKG